jgi:hypothetical protein
MIATYNETTQQLQYESVINYIHQQVQEESMIHINSGGINITTTAGHDYYAKVGTADTTDNSIRWHNKQFTKNAGYDLFSPHSRHSHCKLLLNASNGVERAEKRPLPFVQPLHLISQQQIHAFLTVYGYWLGVGRIIYSGCNGILFNLSNSSDEQYLAQLLQQLNLAAGVDYIYSNAATAQYLASITITNEKWFNYFDQHYSGECSNANADVASIITYQDKLWPWVLRALNKTQLRSLIHGLHRANATQDNRIFTLSPLLRDELVHLCMHAGYSSWFKMNGELNCWEVQWTDDPLHTQAQLNSRDETLIKHFAFSGSVYCVTVPNGLIIARTAVRINNMITLASKAVIIGNCRNCGGVYCDTCSNCRMELPPNQGKVRVCVKCFNNSNATANDTPAVASEFSNLSSTLPIVNASPTSSTAVAGSSSPSSSTAILASELSSLPVPLSQLSSSEEIPLDLPAVLCLVILKKTAVEMREVYNSYVATKRSRGEAEPLSFHQYLYFSTIRTLPDFLFKKTELAFCMMREGGSELVHRESFIRYAPILAPLASKLDADNIYNLLQSYTGNEEGGINFNVFKQYVNNLKKEISNEQLFWPDFKEAFDLNSQGNTLTNTQKMKNKAESLLMIRSGVSDTSSFPPTIGKIGFTFNYLLFESVLFKRKKCIRWIDIEKLERNSEGFLRKQEKGMKLYYHETEENPNESQQSNNNTIAKQEPSVLFWDLPGLGAESKAERLRTFLQLQMMISAHKVSSSISDKLVSQALLLETCETLRRMKAMENINNNFTLDLSCLNPFGNGTETEINSYIQSLQSLVLRSENVKKSKSNWLSRVLPGLVQSGGNIVDNQGNSLDIDPEMKFDSSTAAAAEEREAFSIKSFAYNIRLAKYQLETLFAFFALLGKLRNWENPFATLFTIAVLLNMSYRDYLSYIPALVIFINIIILLIMNQYPQLLADSLTQNKHNQSYNHNEEEEFNNSTNNNHNSNHSNAEDNNPATVSAPSASTNANNSIVIVSPAVSGTVSPSVINPNTLNSLTGKDYLAGTAANDNNNKHATITSSNKSPLSPNSVPSAFPPGNNNNTAAAAAAAAPFVSSSSSSKKSKPVGLIEKFHHYREVAENTRSHLEAAQNSIHRFNVKLFKLEGLYKWTTPAASLRWLIMLVIALLVFLYIPFRYVFPFIVLDFFTAKFQNGSGFQRLLDSVALPEKMPQLD